MNPYETAIAAASRSSAESAMAVKDTIKDPVVVVAMAVASLTLTSAAGTSSFHRQRQPEIREIPDLLTWDALPPPMPPFPLPYVEYLPSQH